MFTALAELTRANKELMKLSQYKSEFLANMSHELRTPLTAIMALTSGLMSKYYGPVTIKQEEHLNSIVKCSKELLGLINDLLDLSKAESGKMALNLSVVEVHLVALQVVNILKPLAESKEIIIQTELTNNGIVIADGAMVKQVITNLLGNAIKFSKSKGVVKVSVYGISHPEEGTVVEIQDCGPGVPEAEQEKIFDAFYQVNRGQKKKSRGTGLGLALVKKIMELHLGYVNVTNLDESKGAVFTVFWPAYPAFENDLD